jgi:hypothetical protein
MSPDANAIWKEIMADVRSKTPRKDPWEIREAWRKAPEFSKQMGRKIIFGGCGYGVGAFFVYCLVEHFFLQPKKQH